MKNHICQFWNNEQEKFTSLMKQTTFILCSPYRTNINTIRILWSTISASFFFLVLHCKVYRNFLKNNSPRLLESLKFHIANIENLVVSIETFYWVYSCTAFNVFFLTLYSFFNYHYFCEKNLLLELFYLFRKFDLKFFNYLSKINFSKIPNS